MRHLLIYGVIFAFSGFLQALEVLKGHEAHEEAAARANVITSEYFEILCTGECENSLDLGLIPRIDDCASEYDAIVNEYGEQHAQEICDYLESQQ